MRVFDFNRAIVRKPGRSVVNGLRCDRTATPEFARLVAEHEAYVDALRRLGLDVDVLPALEAFPDSVFVEDPAFVVPEGAVMLRPGAPSRRGEADAMRSALARHFADVPALEGEACADGGDVLVTPDVIFIGLSARTNQAGAEWLRDALAKLGRKVRIVETPKSVLHFKTAVSLVSEKAVFATPPMAAAGLFRSLDVIVTPYGEDAAANALRVNDTLLVGADFPRSVDVLLRKGFAVECLPTHEIGKLDAGLSCMSLRWWAA